MAEIKTNITLDIGQFVNALKDVSAQANNTAKNINDKLNNIPFITPPIKMPSIPNIIPPIATQGTGAGAGFGANFSSSLKRAFAKIQGTFKDMLAPILSVFGGNILTKGFEGLTGSFVGLIEKGKGSLITAQNMEIAFTQAGLSGDKFKNAIKETSNNAVKLANDLGLPTAKVREYSQTAAALGGATGAANYNLTRLGIAIEKGSNGLIDGNTAIRLFSRGVSDPESEFALGRLTKAFPLLASSLKGIKDPAEATKKALDFFNPTLSLMQKQAGGPIGSMQRLENALGQIKTTLGKLIIEGIAPFVVAFSERILPVVKNFVGFLGTLQVYLKPLTPIFAILGSVVGGLAIGLLVYSGATAIATFATGALATAQTALNFAFLASPIGWVVLGIGALVGAFILLYNNFESFRIIADEVWGGLKIALLAVWEVLKSIGTFLFTIIIEPLKIVWNVLSGFFSIIGGAISQFFNFGQAGKESSNSIISTFTKLSDFLVNISEWFNILGQEVSIAFNYIQTAITKVFDFIKPYLEYAIAGIIIGFQIIYSVLKEIGSFLIDRFVTMWQSFYNAVSVVISGLVRFFKWLNDSISEAFNSVSESIKSAGDNMGWLKNIVNAVILPFKLLYSEIQRLGGPIIFIKSVIGGLAASFEVVKTATNNFFTALKNLDIAGAINAFDGIGEKVGKAFIKGYKDTSEDLKKQQTVTAQEIATTTTKSNEVNKSNDVKTTITAGEQKKVIDDRVKNEKELYKFLQAQYAERAKLQADLEKNIGETRLIDLEQIKADLQTKEFKLESDKLKQLLDIDNTIAQERWINEVKNIENAGNLAILAEQKKAIEKLSVLLKENQKLQEKYNAGIATINSDATLSDEIKTAKLQEINSKYFTDLLANAKISSELKKDLAIEETKIIETINQQSKNKILDIDRKFSSDLLTNNLKTNSDIAKKQVEETKKSYELELKLIKDNSDTSINKKLELKQKLLDIEFKDVKSGINSDASPELLNQYQDYITQKKNINNEYEKSKIQNITDTALREKELALFELKNKYDTDLLQFGSNSQMKLQIEREFQLSKFKIEQDFLIKTNSAVKIALALQQGLRNAFAKTDTKDNTEAEQRKKNIDDEKKALITTLKQGKITREDYNQQINSLNQKSAENDKEIEVQKNNFISKLQRGVVETARALYDSDFGGLNNALQKLQDDFNVIEGSTLDSIDKTQAFAQASANAIGEVGIAAGTNFAAGLTAMTAAGSLSFENVGKLALKTLIDVASKAVPIYAVQIFGSFATMGPWMIPVALATIGVMQGLLAAASSAVGAEEGIVDLKENNLKKRGKTDTIQAWLAPGESVFSKDNTRKNLTLFNAIQNGINAEDFILQNLSINKLNQIIDSKNIAKLNEVTTESNILNYVDRDKKNVQIISLQQFNNNDINSRLDRIEKQLTVNSQGKLSYSKHAFKHEFTDLRIQGSDLIAQHKKTLVSDLRRG